MSGLRCEVSKNLVLSGVKELKMVDSKLVFEDTTSHSHFLAPRDKIGKNMADASLQRLQQPYGQCYKSS